MKVVIAEDDSVVELGLRRMLDHLGHELVGSARNGKEAVQLVESQHPDIAVLDIVMPDMDGLEAAHRIMEKNPVAILILTAFQEHDFVKQAAESGAFAYLLKPVSMKQLGAAIDLAMARFKEQKEFKEKAEQLQHELENRKLVDRARQILSKYLGISEGEALRRMQQESRRQRRKIAETAKAIIATREIISKPADSDASSEDERA
jgi:AmiR/NasT family two-component response regulator